MTRRRLVALISSIALLAALAPGAALAAQPDWGEGNRSIPTAENGNYIVQMAAAPVVVVKAVFPPKTKNLPS